MFSRFQRPALPGWVSCVPSGASARAALVERAQGRRPSVRWVCEEDWSQPAAALRRLRSGRQLARHRVVALLARGQYQVVPTDAPEVPREEWRQALRWQAADLFGFPVESAAIDLIELPSAGHAHARARVLAVAAPQEQIDRLTEPAASARTPLAAVDIPETALRNISALVEPAERAQALLWIGGTGSALVITAGGELVQARALDLSAAQLAAHEDDPARQQALDRAGLELQRTLDSFERMYSQLTMSRLLVAPSAASAQLCAFLRELLYPPVEELDLADSLDLSAVPELADPAALAPWLLAIGAALREA